MRLNCLWAIDVPRHGGVQVELDPRCELLDEAEPVELVAL